MADNSDASNPLPADPSRRHDDRDAAGRFVKGVQPAHLRRPLVENEERDRIVAEFVLRGETGRLPGFPLPRGLHFVIDTREDCERLEVYPKHGRRAFQDFIREYLPELKVIARVRTQAREEYRARQREEAAARAAEVAAKSMNPEPQSSPDVAPVGPTPAPEPEFLIEGYRVTESDVLICLANEGDEMVAAYREGRISKTSAFRKAHDEIRRSVRMGLRIVFRSPTTGNIFLHPKLAPFRVPEPRRQPSRSTP